MKFEKSQKSQRKHVRCVVCGHGFASIYNDLLKSFPVFHPMGDERFECERRFFKALLVIYAHIHQSRTSVSMNTLITNLDWRTTVLLKKDYLIWCLARGYLETDKLNRMLVPEPVNETCHEIFSQVDLNDSQAVNAAVDLLMAALKCLRSELKSFSDDELPTQSPAASTNQAPIRNRTADLIEIQEEAKESGASRPGMATIDRTGAKEFSARQSYARGSAQRKRVT